MGFDMVFFVGGKMYMYFMNIEGPSIDFGEVSDLLSPVLRNSDC
jgi:hypothetical protein